jgi:hypothetical protein
MPWLLMFMAACWAVERVLCGWTPLLLVLPLVILLLVIHQVRKAYVKRFAGFYNLEETGWNWTYLNNSSPEGALQMFLRDIELSNIVSGMPKYTPIWVVRKTVISHAANFAPMPGPGQQKEFKAWCLQHIRLDCFWENSKYLLGFLGGGSTGISSSTTPARRFAPDKAPKVWDLPPYEKLGDPAMEAVRAMSKSSGR